MPHSFDRSDWASLPEISQPYQSTLAFLGDLWDQVDRFRADCQGGDRVDFLAVLQSQIVAHAVVTLAKAGLDQDGGPDSAGRQKAPR